MLKAYEQIKGAPLAQLVQNAANRSMTTLDSALWRCHIIEKTGDLASDQINFKTTISHLLVRS